MIIQPRTLDKDDFKNIMKMSAQLVRRNAALWAIFPILAVMVYGFIMITISAFAMGTGHDPSNNSNNWLAAVGVGAMMGVGLPLMYGLVSLIGICLAMRSDHTMKFGEIWKIFNQSFIRARFYKLSSLGPFGHLILYFLLIIMQMFMALVAVDDPSLVPKAEESPETNMMILSLMIVGNSFFATVLMLYAGVNASIGGVLFNLYDIEYKSASRLAFMAQMKNPILGRISFMFFLACITVIFLIPALPGGRIIQMIFHLMMFGMAPYIFTFAYVLNRELFFDQGNAAVKQKSAYKAGSLQQVFS